MNHSTRSICTGLLIVLALASCLSAAELGELKELDIETAREIALEGNPSLMVAAQRLERARAALSGTRSRYWPTLGVSAGVAHVDLSEAMYQATPGITNPEQYYSAGLQASWVLFDGFARKFSVAIARHGRDESVAARREAQRLVLSAVTAAFLNAQFAIENVEIARSDREFNERQLTEAKARRDAGAGSLGDELSFRVRANAARSAAISASNSLEQARISLAVLMGLPNAELPQKLVLSQKNGQIDLSQVAAPLVELLQYAEENRTDIQQARAALERARAARGTARAAYLPSVVVTAAYEGERAEDASFASEDFGTTAAIGLSVDLFDGGSRRAALRESKASYNEAAAILKEVKLRVAGEVRSAAVAMRAAWQDLNLQNENAESARQNRDLAEQAYKAGQAPLVRLNEAQRDLIAAQGRQAQATVAALQAHNDLVTATGSILDK